MIHESKETKLLVKLCVAAMMAALVFAGNYMRVKIPVSLGGTTAFTLANILCALSGPVSYTHLDVYKRQVFFEYTTHRDVKQHAVQ